jgi:hypothetical protein
MLSYMLSRILHLAKTAVTEEAKHSRDTIKAIPSDKNTCKWQKKRYGCLRLKIQ